MRAIVVRQPWATLIALGIKTIETRPGPPNGPMRPVGARGLPGCRLERGERIAIVAGAAEPGCCERVGHYVSIGHDFDGSWRLVQRDEDLFLAVADWPMPLGAVVCTVVVANAAEIATEDTGGDCWPTLEVSDSTLTYWPWGDGEHPDAYLDDQLPLGDFTPGRWGWMLTDPRPCDPVPCKGRQGVFELPAEVAAMLRDGEHADDSDIMPGSEFDGPVIL